MQRWPGLHRETLFQNTGEGRKERNGGREKKKEGKKPEISLLCSPSVDDMGTKITLWRPLLDQGGVLSIRRGEGGTGLSTWAQSPLCPPHILPHPPLLSLTLRCMPASPLHGWGN